MIETGGCSETTSVMISNVRLAEERGRVDIEVVDGRIAALRAHSGSPAEAAIDGQEGLLLPAFVDGHVHLDKTLWGLPWIPYQGGAEVRSRIAAEKRIRREHLDGAGDRARALARRLLSLGSTAIRTHVDIDEQSRLTGFYDLLELRDEFADSLDIQIVAFPQSGLWAGPDVVADLDEALANGADAIGGVDPTVIDGDVDRSLNQIFALAEKHAAGVDLHLHEAGEPGAAVIMGMCERARRGGLGGRVVVSHAFCLASISEPRLAEIADAMAEAGIAVMTSAPGRGVLIPVMELAARGVTVFAGSDNIRDAWAPFGNGDMLDRARLLAYRGDLRHDEGLQFAFDCITQNAARALGFPSRQIAVGDQADFVLLNTPSVQEAVCEAPATRRVIRKGQIVAQHSQSATN